MGFAAVFGPLRLASLGSPLRHSAKRCATSPAGEPPLSGATRQLSRTRESQNATCRLLPPTFTGEVARRAGEGNNNQCGGWTELSRLYSIKMKEKPASIRDARRRRQVLHMEY